MRAPWPNRGVILLALWIFLSPSEKQIDVASQHEKLIVALNYTMEEKATATVYISEAYTRISFEKEEIESIKKSTEEVEEEIEKQKGEYLAKKQLLASHVSGNIYSYYC